MLNVLFSVVLFVLVLWLYIHRFVGVDGERMDGGETGGDETSRAAAGKPMGWHLMHEKKTKKTKKHPR